MGRKTACLLVFVGSTIIGLLSCFGYSIWSDVLVFGMQFLDFFDFISNSVLMPVVAFLTCIFIGYVVKMKTITDEIDLNQKAQKHTLLTVMIKYIAPICIVLILVSSVLDALGIMKI